MEKIDLGISDVKKLTKKRPTLIIHDVFGKRHIELIGYINININRSSLVNGIVDLIMVGKTLTKIDSKDKMNVKDVLEAYPNASDKDVLEYVNARILDNKELLKINVNEIDILQTFGNNKINIKGLRFLYKCIATAVTLVTYTKVDLSLMKDFK